MKAFYEIIINCDGLTVQHFRTYERQMPETRKRLHLAINQILESGATISQVAKFLGVDRGKIYRMKYGADIDFLPQRWSIEEEKTIKKLAPKYSYKIIADVLKRSQSAVTCRAKQLGISKYKTLKQQAENA